MKCLKYKHVMKRTNKRTFIDSETDETIREHTFTCVHCGVTEVFEK